MVRSFKGCTIGAGSTVMVPIGPSPTHEAKFVVAIPWKLNCALLLLEFTSVKLGIFPVPFIELIPDIEPDGFKMSQLNVTPVVVELKLMAFVLDPVQIA